VTRGLPPAWPREVGPPVGDAWPVEAVAWLLDQCPGDFRGYPVLMRHPRVLAEFAADHVDAQRQGLRSTIASLRSRLRDEAPDVVVRALAVAEREQARLELVAASVEAVRQALLARGPERSGDRPPGA
jgi:hypothetical protein